MESSFSRHVIDYGWKDNRLVLLTRDLDHYKDLLELEIGSEINLRRQDEQICTGWSDFDRMILMPCDKRNTVKGSQNQCWECREREGFYLCISCNGEKCPILKPSVERYCRQTHFLYLICFGNEKIKVGTASQFRKNARILEQGPLVAAFVASAPGPNIRQMEKAVSNLGYTERMTRQEKLKCLASKMSIDEAQKLVLSAYEDIRLKLEERFDYYWLNDPELINLDYLYKRQDIFMQPELINFDATEFTSGKVVANRGNFIVLNHEGILRAVDLFNLKSHIVDFNPKDDNRLNDPQQLGFFDKLFG